MWRVRAAVALSLCASVGCSSIFDLDHFDEGSGEGAGQHTTTENGTTTSITEREGGPTTPITQSAVDGGGTNDDAGTTVDAGCASETESNDTSSSANAIGLGQTCGLISDPGDVDVFKIHLDAPAQITIETFASLTWDFDDGWATGSSSKSSFSRPAGDHHVMFTAAASSNGAYRITIAQ